MLSRPGRSRLQPVGCMSLRCAHLLTSRSRTQNWPQTLHRGLTIIGLASLQEPNSGLLSYASERYDALADIERCKAAVVHPSRLITRYSPRSFLSEQSAWQSCRDNDRRRQFDIRWRDAPLPGFEGNSCSWRRLYGRLMRALAAGYDHQQTRYSKAGLATPRCGAALLCRQFGAFAQLSSDRDCYHWLRSDSSWQRLAISNGRPVSRA